MNRKNWLKERQKGIGGSDVAGILGISPFSTPLDVYLDKIGEAEEKPDNPSMAFGRLMEPVLLQQYQNVTGESLVSDLQPIISPKHEFMRANLDGLTKSGKVLEIKTARTNNGWGEPGTDEIPDYYLTQVQHYLAVTDLPIADVAVLISGCEFLVYTVEKDLELQEMLIEKEAKFWEMVQKRTQPDPVNLKDIIKIYPRSLKNGIEANQDVIEQIGLLKSLKEQIKDLEEIKEQKELFIKDFIREHDGILMDNKPLVTWKSSKDSVKTNWEKAYESLNGIINDSIFLSHKELYTSTTPGSRRFLIK